MRISERLIYTCISTCASKESNRFPRQLHDSVIFVGFYNMAFNIQWKKYKLMIYLFK